MMNKSSLFFTTPSFLRGLATILDIGSTLIQSNISNTSEEADLKALRSDWEMVGDDLRKAMEKWEYDYSNEYAP